MPRIDPSLVPVLTDLERGLRELGIPFAIVGALVPELLLEARPRRMTNDADVTVTVDHLADFNALKDRLAAQPLYAFLKLVAFSDRKAAKDLSGVLHCLEHYEENEERRYGVDHGGEGVPFEYTCAYLLGVDGQRFLDAALSTTVRAVLDRFNEPTADVVSIAARDRRRGFIDDESRTVIFELFRWYRLGSGLQCSALTSTGRLLLPACLLGLEDRRQIRGTDFRVPIDKRGAFEYRVVGDYRLSPRTDSARTVSRRHLELLSEKNAMNRKAKQDN